MNGIQKVFENKKAFIPFITAGGPDLSVTKELVPAMAEAGADLIEIGIPFSDPVAKGIMIQETDMHTLASGTTTGKTFDDVRRIRLKTDVPLALMAYINPIFAYGVDKFMKQMADHGVDTLTVPDMPFEECRELLPACRQYELVLIYLMAPTSGERAQAITRESEGFVCCVSSLGMTGMREEITTNIKEVMETVEQGKNVPCAIGFGISTPEQATKMAAQSNGTIVGGTIVKIVAEYGTLCVKPVYDYVHKVKQAVGAWGVIKRERSVSGEQFPVMDFF